MSEFDPISRPKHYCEGRKYEPIDVILDWDLNFCLGQVVKYVSRAGRKGDILDDINKALYYLERAKEEIVLNNITKQDDEDPKPEEKKHGRFPWGPRTKAFGCADLCRYLEKDGDGDPYCTNLDCPRTFLDNFPIEDCEYYDIPPFTEDKPHRCYNCKYGAKPGQRITCHNPLYSGTSPYLYYEENDCSCWEDKNGD